MTKDQMVGCQHRFSGHEFEQTLGDGEGQGNLVCCSSLGHKESDMTERLNDSKNSAFQHKLFSTQAQRILDLMNQGRLSSYFFSGANKSYS